MRPEDLLACAEFLTGSFRPATDRDWSVRAGTLDWDVATTVVHVAAHLTKATTYLAAPASTWSPLVVTHDPRATNDQLLDGVDVGARGLAFVAAHVEESTRGFHAWGMGDASAFLARAGNEVLVHGWDIADGLGVAFEPPGELCSAVLRRRFPWISEDVEPWQTLLRAEGRTGEDHWLPFEGPLEEWTGAPSGGPRPPAIAWDWDPATERWLPRFPWPRSRNGLDRGWPGPYGAPVAKKRKGSQLIPPGPRPRVPAAESALAAQLIGLSEDELFERLSVEHLSTFVHQKLWKMGARDNGVLGRGLKHPDARVRAVCATMLDHFLDDRAVDEVVACLDDPDGRVRAKALHTLGCDRCKEGSCRPGEAAFVPTALRLARQDPEPAVRRTAIETLARSSARHSEPVLELLGVVRDRDPDIRVRKVADRWATQLARAAARSH